MRRRWRRCAAWAAARGERRDAAVHHADDRRADAGCAPAPGWPRRGACCDCGARRASWLAAAADRLWQSGSLMVRSDEGLEYWRVRRLVRQPAGVHHADRRLSLSGAGPIPYARDISTEGYAYLGAGILLLGRRARHRRRVAPLIGLGTARLAASPADPGTRVPGGDGVRPDRDLRAALLFNYDRTGGDRSRSSGPTAAWSGPSTTR